MNGRILTACAVAAALITSSAQAAVIQERGGLTSATNGIALGADGNLWVSEYVTGNVVRMTPDGTVLNRIPVGSNPTSIATGPGNRVWVAITGSNQLGWFDATLATPTLHTIGTGTGCGPVAIVAGGDGRMYFSKPSDDTCVLAPRIGSVLDNGTGVVSTQTGLGQAFDLEVSGGKLFVPDVDSDAVRRLALGTLTPETSIGAPGGPDGITADGRGNLWITLFSSGRVARFPATQNLGTVTELTPTGGTLSGPFGIVAGTDGRIYVTGSDSANLARIEANGTFRFYSTTNGQPWQIVNGPDGDLYFTDTASTRIFRFLSAPPRATTGAASAVAANAASATAIVDSRGNDTQVVFDYGATAAYGATSAPVNLPAGSGGVPVTVVLSGLIPATGYHVRVRAINEEGTVAGADTTVTTLPGDADGDGVAPPVDCNDGNAAIRPGAVDKPGDKIDQDCNGADAKFPLLKARSNFSWAFTGSRTLLTKVDVTGLAGGETIKVTCKGKGCSFKTKTYKKVKKGKKSLTSLFGRQRKLSKGARIEVRVTGSSAVGSSAVLTVGKRKKDPKIVRRCLRPGASKTSRCA
jgi:sugar lactone lactonase YvrE